MKNSKLPRFHPAFLAPKYWGFWLGIGIWRALLFLPYPILRRIGNGLGALFCHLKVGKRRAAIARRNLELCFPDMRKRARSGFTRKFACRRHGDYRNRYGLVLVGRTH